MGYQGLDPNEALELNTISCDGVRRYRCSGRVDWSLDVHLVRPVSGSYTVCLMHVGGIQSTFASPPVESSVGALGYAFLVTCC